MPKTSQSKQVILIVEDDEAARLMMASTLEDAHFTALTAKNCAQARELFLQHEQIDLIMLDVLLPDGDGFQLCAEFHKTPKGHSIPIAMVTGLDDIESIERGYQNGATDFITKPVSWGTIPFRVRYIMRSSRTLNDLSLSESKTRALLSAIPDIIMRVERSGILLDMQVGSYVFDLKEWLFQKKNEAFFRLPPPVFTALEYSIQKALQGEGLQLIEFQWPLNLPQERFWEARILFRDDEEVLIVVREVTQRKLQDLQLRLWSKVFESSSEAIMITDPEFKIISVNQAYEKITGFTESEVLGIDTMKIGAHLHMHSFFRNLGSILLEQGHWQGELYNQRKNGEVFPTWYSISKVTSTDGTTENFIAIFNDITEFKNSRAQIDFLAHHDNLTGLPNRVLLNDRLNMAIHTAQRENEKVAVVFIDLDRFKNINDSFGHSAGDQLLKETSKRLTSIIRSCDSAARLGGDEFVLLITKVAEVSEIVDFMIRLRETLQQPYDLAGISVHVPPSIGIAIYPEDGDNAGALIKNADAAMYLAKEKGRNNFQFYTPALNARTLDRLKLESDLRLALEQNQFELHYQPQVFSNSNELWGAEALVRWRHPERGLVPPLDFIPLAEETGLIIPLGEWVLKQAAFQVTEWRIRGLPKLVVSVNISALQFRQENFSDVVKTLLKSVNAAPDSIELELTESILMHDMPSSILTLQELRDTGFRIAIDDFGTGYSSLNYLRRLPLNALKIDQSFVREMLSESASLAIVETIINLAHSLGIETIAEGVETEAQSNVLFARNCRFMQGYYFSKPLPSHQFEEWVLQKTGINLSGQK